MTASRSRVLELCCALASPPARPTALAALAGELSAEAVLLFVIDPRVGALVPAADAVPRVPGGPSWVAMLSRCAEEGEHSAEVAWPDREQRRPAKALVGHGLAFIVIGARARLPDPLEVALPLLAGYLQVEQVAAQARGELAVEREAARHGSVLMAALERARAELERTVTESARLARELGEASRAKDEFLAMLGHELRNPLAPIVTALQLIKLRGDDTAPKEHAIIQRHVAHLTRLVDDLLDVARVTRGKVELKKTVIEVSTAIEKALEMASPLVEERQHTLDLEVPATGCAVEADEGRLCQVLTNLLTNSARYTPPAGAISVRAWRSGDRVNVSVKDSGIGIDAELLPRLWDPFVQGVSSKGKGGLGLGLALVKNLVELHGGEVVARSAGTGKGSEFQLWLPASGQPAANAEVSPVAPTSHRSGARRVLVVDDNVDAADMLAEALQLEGHEVRVCHDGPAALSCLERFVPDVAILDIGLPVMDGNELARRLRQRPELKGLRMIAITGYGRDSDKMGTRDSGFDHHLVKPLDLAELAAVMA